MSRPAIIPAVHVVFTLEDTAPRVRTVFARETDEHRMADWLEQRPELLNLIQRALDLEAEERAA